MKPLRPTAVGSVIALVFMTDLSSAQETSEPVATPVTLEEAISVALNIQPGTIGEAELDEFEGKPAYDIEVINSVGDEVEFKIDAETGAVLNQWTDDDPSNDPVAGTTDTED